MSALSKFTSSLANLTDEEARKAKLNYLRNALMSYAVYVEDAAKFGFMQIAFVVVPVCWPLLYLQRRSIVRGSRQQRATITLALATWQDDLGEDALALQRELDRLTMRAPRLRPWPKKQPAQLSGPGPRA